MELDITRFFNEAEPMDYSASVAEIGNDAGRSTWQAAMDDAEDWNLLDTEGKQQQFRDYCRDFGAWDDAERAAWTAQECNALLLQFIAGDMRWAGMAASWNEGDWLEYDADDSKAGRIFRGDDGRVYYYIGD